MRRLGGIVSVAICVAHFVLSPVQAHDAMQDNKQENIQENWKQHRLLRDLLQWVKEEPVRDSVLETETAPDKTWWMPPSPCHDHCQECNLYGHCSQCKEGYVPTRSGTGLACACIDRHCFSCPDDPGVCKICADFNAEPDEAGICVCQNGYVYDEETGTCVERDNLIFTRPPKTAPAPEPVLEPPPAPEPATPVVPSIPIDPVNPAPEQPPENSLEESPGLALDPLDPAIVGDPLCRDVLCSRCPDNTDVCETCVSNSSKDASGDCACDPGFTKETSINGSGCLKSDDESDSSDNSDKNDKNDNDTINDEDENTGVGVRPKPPTTPTNGQTNVGLSVRPLTGVGSAGQGDVTITPIFEEKIRELAEKYGITLGDKFESLVQAKEDVSEAVASAISDKASMAVDFIDGITAAKADAASASNVVPAAGDGFQYTNIRLETVTPEEFYGDSAGMLSQQSAYADGVESDNSGGLSKLKGWLSNKLKKDDELVNARAPVPASVSGRQEEPYVSGFDGTSQPLAPSPPHTLTPEDVYKKGLLEKKALLIDLLKETDDAMRAHAKQRAKGADDQTKALMSMLQATDDEVERRIT